MQWLLNIFIIIIIIIGCTVRTPRLELYAKGGACCLFILFLDEVNAGF